MEVHCAYQESRFAIESYQIRHAREAARFAADSGRSWDATRKNLREFYKMASANSIVNAIADAIGQPAEVEIDEMVIRPTAQDF